MGSPVAMFTRVSSFLAVAELEEAGAKALEVLMPQAAMNTASALGWKAMLGNVLQCNEWDCCNLSLAKNIVRGQALA